MYNNEEIKCPRALTEKPTPRDTQSEAMGSSWFDELHDELQKPYMEELRAFLRSEIKAKKQIFPPKENWFEALRRTPFQEVKAVILGQDPYHGEGQAHGLCFSVQKGVKPPPSLVNIFKEIHRDLGLPISKCGDLTSWADQGVLLLNATLTVVAGQAGSHQKRGWETFTDAVISKLASKRSNLVFFLWGSYAQAKEQLVDTQRHLVLKAPHPSPLSAHRGFLGCGHFSRANEYIKEQGEKPIDWRVV